MLPGSTNTIIPSEHSQGGKMAHRVMEVSTCAGLMVYTFTPSVFSAEHSAQRGQSSERRGAMITLGENSSNARYV